MTDSHRTLDAEPGPCQCHTSFAYTSPTHPGHCCFQPATQTCHPAEVAAWEAEAPYRRGEKARPIPANVTMRTCAWCETTHPEHVSIEWTHGERLYFCTDTCHREWSEHG